MSVRFGGDWTCGIVTGSSLVRYHFRDISRVLESVPGGARKASSISWHGCFF